MSEAMDKGHEWLEENMDQLFIPGVEPQAVWFYGTEEEAKDWFERIKALATGDEAPPPRSPRPHTGGIIGAIRDHLEDLP